VGRRTMTHFSNVDGILLPEQIELTQGTHRIEITYLSRRVNRELSDKHLELRLSDEVRMQEK